MSAVQVRPAAAFTPMVAELDDAVVGYAFFAPRYNTDVAARSMWLHDIFVARACALWPAPRPSPGMLIDETIQSLDD